MNPARLISNLQAKAFLASVKSGALLKGTVRSVDDSVDAAWIAIEFPELDERRVQVKKAGNLQAGDMVILQCVPDPSRPEHYLFRVATAPTQTTADKNQAPCRGSEMRFRRAHRC